MLNLENLKVGGEYYFYFSNHYCTGFLKNIQKNTLQIIRGIFCYSGKDDYAYETAYIDADHIIGYATT